MLKKGLLALLSLALVVLMPACGHKNEAHRNDGHHHHGKAVEAQDSYKEKKSTKQTKAKKVKKTKTQKKTVDRAGKEYSTKTETKEVTPATEADVDDAQVYGDDHD